MRKSLPGFVGYAVDLHEGRKNFSASISNLILGFLSIEDSAFYDLFVGQGRVIAGVCVISILKQTQHLF